MFRNRVWSISRWDRDDNEIGETIYFHTRIPVWLLRLIANCIVIPAPHQLGCREISMYTEYPTESNPTIVLWERRYRQ